MSTVLDGIPATKSKPGRDYLALVERFPLRSIGDSRQHAAALAVLDKLVGYPNLSAGEVEYMDALASLVERFESQHHEIPSSGRTPLQRLRDLMESSGMTPAKLGDVIGSRPAASMVLSGERELSKAHIRQLSAHFKINPGYFL